MVGTAIDDGRYVSSYLENLYTSGSLCACFSSMNGDVGIRELF